MNTPVAPVSNWTPPTAGPTWFGGTGIKALMQDPLLGPALMALLEKEKEKQDQGTDKSTSGYYSYGKEPDVSSVLNAEDSAAQNEESAVEDTGNSYSKDYPSPGAVGYKKGGSVMNSPLMAATGGHIADKHHPEYDGKTPIFRTGGLSNHVQGPGDGQSDDIPAMLADGEWVMDAEGVSQLGNGSNKAGAEVLDAMREALRAHKRSAPINKIPPKSKSPLQYIKEGMKMKNIKLD